MSDLVGVVTAVSAVADPQLPPLGDFPAPPGRATGAALHDIGGVGARPAGQPQPFPQWTARDESDREDGDHHSVFLRHVGRVLRHLRRLWLVSVDNVSGYAVTERLLLLARILQLGHQSDPVRYLQRRLPTSVYVYPGPGARRGQSQMDSAGIVMSTAVPDGHVGGLRPSEPSSKRWTANYRLNDRHDVRCTMTNDTHAACISE